MNYINLLNTRSTPTYEILNFLQELLVSKKENSLTYVGTNIILYAIFDSLVIES